MFMSFVTTKNYQTLSTGNLCKFGQQNQRNNFMTGDFNSRKKTKLIILMSQAIGYMLKSMKSDKLKINKNQPSRASNLE